MFLIIFNLEGFLGLGIFLARNIKRRLYKLRES